MSIYLDHAATTAVFPEVIDAMLPFLNEKFGNPSSIHQFGREVRTAIDHSRSVIAEEINAKPHEIFFTSGGTEANNLALIGTALAMREKQKDHIITTSIEHPAVLEACRYLERIGFRVTYLPVDQTGKVEINHVRDAIHSHTAMVSVIFGNNEVGTIQSIRQIGEIAQESGVLFHTDAVQAFGVEEIAVDELFVNLLTISSHKVGGPKGIGALYVSEKSPLLPRMFGGSQERRKRPGTENVTGIIGFGKAVSILSDGRESHRLRMQAIRQQFMDELEKRAIRFIVNGHSHDVLPHICNISFPGIDSEAMLINLDLNRIACSSGSACTSGSLEKSHVLKAMNLSEEVIHSAIRFSFGYHTTEEEITQTAEVIEQIIHQLSKSMT